MVMLRDKPTHFSSHPWTPDAIEGGQVEVRIARWVLTANTLTYAFMGDLAPFFTFQHFPLPGTDQTNLVRSPTWGVGVVSSSRHPEVAVGTKVYG